jgi:hypothetical protein
MFDGAPQGGDVLDAFKPHMTSPEIAQFEA